MDVLAEVLAVTRLANSTLCSESFVGPWGLVFAPSNRATFHIVIRGGCWLLPGSGLDAIQLNQGDVALLPHGTGHTLTDQPDTSNQHFRHYGTPPAARDGPRQDTTTLFCGGYHFEQDGVNPITSLLPPIVHLPADSACGDRDLQDVVHLLMRESAKRAPGGSTVVARLMDVLFVYVVRAWLQVQPQHAAGWIGALRDPQVGRALAMMHEAPRQPWTVESLASAVDMSRATFAKRFTAMVGDPPLTYLRRWRIELAARLLRESDQRVGSIANQVGYDSATTFSRTFRQNRGLAPGEYRKRVVARLRTAPRD